MYTAADLLDALRRRRTLKSIRPEAPGALPPGWAQWLERMPERQGAVTGAPPGAFVDQFLQRSPRPPPRRSPMLSRWQAFATLWRQQWEPAPRDERALRVVSMSASMVVHLLLGALLAWFMYMQFLWLLAPVEDGGEATVTQVEYVGTGTPEDAGGGPVPPVREDAVAAPARDTAVAAAPAPAPAPEAQPDPDPAPARAPALPELPVDVATPALATRTPPLPQRDIPTPSLPAEQPLQVTEVAVPDITFVLPPPTTRADPVRAPELAVPSRDVPAPEIVEAIEAELPSRLPAVEVATPAPPRPVIAVPDVAVATIPEPAARDGAGEADSDADATSEVVSSADGADLEADDAAADAGAADAMASASEVTQGAQAPAADAGTGPETAAAPGGWPSPVRGDDWDDALRDRDGGRADGGEGLFDGTGRPLLAGSGTGEGTAPAGAPPGSEARQAIDLERGGTWLRRPPLDHRPTRFDAFWIPTGTLLEEWVRRGIKEMSIPIPGTSMEIVCVVSILQLGGGCGLSNPNINDQPSSGRAAPEVPFKPELQEDQDVLADPPGG